MSRVTRRPFGCGRMTEESEEEAASLEMCCNQVAQGKATMSFHITATPSFLCGLGSLTLKGILRQLSPAIPFCHDTRVPQNCLGPMPTQTGHSKS